MRIENWKLLVADGGTYVDPRKHSSDGIMFKGVVQGSEAAIPIKGYCVQERAFVSKNNELVRLGNPDPNYASMLEAPATKLQSAIEQKNFHFVVWSNGHAE